MSTEEKKRIRRPKPRHTHIVLGALDENARMLCRDPHSEGIGQRIAELLAELHLSLDGGKDKDSEDSE